MIEFYNNLYWSPEAEAETSEIFPGPKLGRYINAIYITISDIYTCIMKLYGDEKSGKIGRHPYGVMLDIYIGHKHAKLMIMKTWEGC